MKFFRTPDGRYIAKYLYPRYGTGDFFPKDNFLPFEEARKFVRSLNLKTQKEWFKYRKLNKKPDNIPSNPNRAYRDYWTGWGDFLGTRRIPLKDRNYLSFEEAREFARSLKLKNQTEWKEYCKSGNKPDNMPSTPYRTYKNEWISMGDFLGTGFVATYSRNYLPFPKARKFVRSLNLKSQKEWQKYSKSGKKPDNIPAHSNRTYKGKGWISWGDFLGTGNVCKKEFLSFKEARKFVKRLKLKSQKEWHEYRKSGKKPNNIPSNPNRTYKNKGWVSWGEFLGTGRISYKNRVYLPFPEAKDFVSKLKSRTEWNEYCKSGKKPDSIPLAPHCFYKDKGWISWGDFLGKKR